MRYIFMPSQLAIRTTRLGAIRNNKVLATRICFRLLCHAQCVYTMNHAKPTTVDVLSKHIYINHFCTYTYKTIFNVLLLLATLRRSFMNV